MQPVLLLRSVSVLNKILSVKCGIFIRQTKWQETVGSWQEAEAEGQRVVVGGRVDISAVVVEGGNSVCFCLHFIPFLMVPFEGKPIRQKKTQQRQTLKNKKENNYTIYTKRGP